MNVNSTNTSSLLSGAYEEYRRYERYLALAYAIGLVTVTVMFFPGGAWPGCVAVATLLAISFRQYHRAVHRYVGLPGPDTDQAVQVWGTAAQACVWGSVPIVLALAVLQFVH
ncbi:hypothetical protein KEM60_01220 [Austwickia sp. TVS 96-490-7B]|uniref:hypothetical protein n=1 Tax=Austwickia sp. TVS 96-490-7B TaxID=2830843 RepID=UPI001C58F03A|nr:hypothetical protein [Austwickia sp. TVS 96-490-7B]MBW3085028.1 hypothetical protein [Austwickia sp. TVS 96-490-7B]